jgi:hypothetical protein
MGGANERTLRARAEGRRRSALRRHRAQVAAARLRVRTDERLGVQTPESIKRVARLIPA